MKYIFFKIAGTLIHEKNCEPNRAFFSNPFDTDAINILNIIIKDTGAKIILLDAPKDIPYIATLQKFTDAGFEYQENIIGQVLDIDRVLVKTPYDELGLAPFPILVGNCIKHWVDNFIAKPYNLNTELKKEFEIWEKPTIGKTSYDEHSLDLEYRGMKVLKAGKDFKYRILGNVEDLLLEQQGKIITVKFEYGLNIEDAKKLILSF